MAECTELEPCETVTAEPTSTPTVTETAEPTETPTVTETATATATATATQTETVETIACGTTEDPCMTATATGETFNDALVIGCALVLLLLAAILAAQLRRP